jgi:hypothetical protein
MRKKEIIEADFRLLQKELRKNMLAAMQDYGDEKLPLYPQDLKNPTGIWYYDDLSEEYRKGMVTSVISNAGTLFLEVETEFGDTLQLHEDCGELVFDVPAWMLAIYGNMLERIESERNN